jgi:hypothetical protein
MDSFEQTLLGLWQEAGRHADAADLEKAKDKGLARVLEHGLLGLVGVLDAARLEQDEAIQHDVGDRPGRRWPSMVDG